MFLNYFALFLFLFDSSFKSPTRYKLNDFIYQSNERLLQEKILFLGEIKGVSYVKMTLVSASEAAGAYSRSNLINYKGSYYEAVSGKTYPVIGVFNTETREWLLKSFATDNSIFGIFSGKQGLDGNIEGYWKLKEKKYRFYLKKQERSELKSRQL